LLDHVVISAGIREERFASRTLHDQAIRGTTHAGASSIVRNNLLRIVDKSIDARNWCGPHFILLRRFDRSCAQTLSRWLTSYFGRQMELHLRKWELRYRVHAPDLRARGSLISGRGREVPQ
jgi:hypothetical protein